MEAAVFERAYRVHARGVFHAALQVLGDGTRAQDVVQDVFLRLWDERARYDSRRGPIGSYLRMVGRSRALDIWRAEQVASRANERMRVLAAGDEGPLEQRPLAAVERNVGEALVRGALMRLPDLQREAIVLTYWGGLTAEQIASSSGTPLGTVKSRIRLGVLKLREQCAPDLADVPLAA
jgi:RNA polymerase sigma-70 factor (ECF subfamily)